MEALLIITLIILFIAALQWIISYIYKRLTNHPDQISFQKKNQLHLTRRLQHISTGIFVFIFTLILPHNIALWTAFISFLLFLILHFTRKHFKWINELYIKNFLVLWLCDIHVARLCILFVTFGDPMASIIGLSTKSPQIMKGKSIYGSLGGSLTCGIVGLLYYMMYIRDQFSEKIEDWQFLFLSSVIGLIAELLPAPRKYFLDDNLMIQLYTGIQFTYIWKFIVN